MPLLKESRAAARTVRYNASWSSGPGYEALEEQNGQPSTFQLLRVMKHQAYRAGTKIGQVSGYIHETIELCVFAGRSKELVPLGITSLVITGDEDGEVETSTNGPVDFRYRFNPCNDHPRDHLQHFRDDLWRNVRWHDPRFWSHVSAITADVGSLRFGIKPRCLFYQKNHSLFSITR